MGKTKPMGKISVIKFLALLSIALGSLFQSASSQVARCTKSQNCMACNSNSKLCDACFNWYGLKLPLKLQNGICNVRLKRITDCQWYSGTYSSGNIPVDYCKSCTGSNMLVYASWQPTLVCSGNSAESVDTACGVVEIPNCDQVFCYKVPGSV